MKRDDSSVILHFDCFYASVVEAENPALRSLPLAVQQKQIVVTCNYEARRRGLHKLQLITDAKKICPDVVIVLGEDLTRFRNASKDLYNFIRSFSWSGKVEKLGFDEVFLDVTDIVRFNLDVLNRSDLSHSFFCLSREDPTSGFSFDATSVAGHTYSVHADLRTDPSSNPSENDNLWLRLMLGSHLAQFLRLQLEEHRGYTSTVGISTSKLLSKLVGNLHKPKGQTTLIPPYNSLDSDHNNVTAFIDQHEIGKIPGVGFKLAQKIRNHVLGRQAQFHDGLVYGGTKEDVSVKDVRLHPGMSSDHLEKILAGPGAPHGIGLKIWRLVHGIDDAEVGKAREVPRQISIEDSYLRLDAYEQMMKELKLLSISLITRIRTDLLEHEDEPTTENDVPGLTPQSANKRWLAFPRTIRLSTRPRPAQNPDGSRNRSFARISRSGPVPSYLFSLSDSIDVIAQKLVVDVLVPLFRKLHPEKSGWNLSLINVAVTDMVEAAGNNKDAAGRDISKMFRHQKTVLQEWKVKDEDVPPDIDPPLQSLQSNDASTPADNNGSDRSATLESFTSAPVRNHLSSNTDSRGSEDLIPLSSQVTAVTSETDWKDPDAMWDSDSSFDSSVAQRASSLACPVCGAFMPAFAMPAHERFHEMDD